MAGKLAERFKKAKLLHKEGFINDFAYDSEGWLLPDEVRGYVDVQTTPASFFWKAASGTVKLGRAYKGTQSSVMSFVSGSSWQLNLSALGTNIDRSETAVISIFWWDDTAAKMRAVSTTLTDFTKSSFQLAFTDEFIADAPQTVSPSQSFEVKFPTIKVNSTFHVKYTRGGVLRTAICNGSSDALHPGYYEVMEGTDQVAWVNSEGIFYVDWSVVGVPDDGSTLVVDYESNLFTASSITDSLISITINNTFNSGASNLYAVWQDEDVASNEYTGNGVETLFHIINHDGVEAGIRTANDYDQEVRRYYAVANILASEGEFRTVSFFARKVIGSNTKVYVRQYDETGGIVDFSVTPVVHAGDSTVNSNNVEFDLTDEIQRYGVTIKCSEGVYLIGIETSSDTGEAGSQQILMTGIQSHSGDVLTAYSPSFFVDYIPRPLPEYGSGMDKILGKLNEVLLSDGQGASYWGSISGSGLAITELNSLTATEQITVPSVVTTDIDPTITSAVATHTWSYLDTFGQWDVDFDIVGNIGHLTYGTTGYDDSYLDKRGLVPKYWSDRTRQMYEGVHRGASSYSFYASGSGATSGLTLYADIGLNDHNFYGFGALTIPLGTTAQQPTGSDGSLRYDTDKDSYMAYSTSGWKYIDFTETKSGYSGFYSSGSASQRIYESGGNWYFEVSGFRAYCVKGLYFETSATETIQITGAAGKKYITYNSSGVLQILTTGFDWINQAGVAIVYWTGTQAHSVGWEHHGMTDADDHYWKHFTIGTRYVNGLAISHNASTVGVAPANDTGSYFWMTGGRLLDEDIKIDVSSTTAPSSKWDQNLGSGFTSTSAGLFPLLYVDGTSIARYVAPNSGRFPFGYSGTNGTPQYDNAGTLTATPSGNFAVYWVLGSSTQVVADTTFTKVGTAVYLRPHNAYYGSITAARDASISDLSWGEISVEESKVLYRVIYEVNTAWTLATHRCKVVEVNDFRASAPIPVTSIGSGVSPSDHTILTNLNGGQYGDGDHFNVTVFHLAAAAPTANDDVDSYKVGSLWYNSSASDLYICSNNTDTAAVWRRIFTNVQTSNSITLSNQQAGLLADLKVQTSNSTTPSVPNSSGLKVDIKVQTSNSLTLSIPDVSGIKGDVKVQNSTSVTLSIPDASGIQAAVVYGGEPGAVSSSTSGASGSANTASRSDHSHDLGSHAHTTTSNGGILSSSSISDWSTAWQTSFNAATVWGAVSATLMRTAYGYAKIISPEQDFLALSTVANRTLNCNSQHVFARAGYTTGTPMTMTFTHFDEGQTVNVVISSSGGAYTLAWTGVRWNILGVPTPTNATLNTRYDMYTFIKIGGIIYGAAILNMS